MKNAAKNFLKFTDFVCRKQFPHGVRTGNWREGVLVEIAIPAETHQHVRASKQHRPACLPARVHSCASGCPSQLRTSTQALRGRWARTPSQPRRTRNTRTRRAGFASGCGTQLGSFDGQGGFFLGKTSENEVEGKQTSTWGPGYNRAHSSLARSFPSSSRCPMYEEYLRSLQPRHTTLC